MKALITADFDPKWQATLASQVDLTPAGYNIYGTFASRLNEADLIKALQGMDIFVVGYEQVTQKVFDQTPDLKLIASIRGGPEENIDVEAAKKAGVPIIRTIGRTQHPVAEHTFALMLALSRPIIRSNNLVRAKQWTPDNRPAAAALSREATELFGKTLGMVGIGNIGEWVAHLGNAFGMRVLGYDPYLPAARAAEMGVTLVDKLNTLMSEADYVTVHARVAPETMGLIGKEQFRAMKPTAAFINTARSALIDSNALVQALNENWIRAAALDVYDKEPLPLDNPLYAIPPEKLIMTTHLAGLSQERIPYHSEHLVRDINAYLRGNKFPALFDPSVFDEPAFANKGGKIFGVWKGKP